MARYRRIKPEFYSDDKIIELTHSARLFFIGMWTFSDDTGVIQNKPRMLKAQIFPADDISVDDVQDILRLLYECSLIAYNDDQTLIRVKGFLSHQKIDRPQPSKYVFVEGQPGQFDEPSTNTRRPIVNTVKLSKVKISKDKLKENGQIQEAFDQLWIRYPKKVKKARCLRVFNGLSKTKREACIKGVKRYIEYWELNGTSLSHVPMLSSFINDARWEDELDMSRSQDSLKITPASNRYADMYMSEKQEVIDPKDIPTPEEVSNIFKEELKKHPNFSKKREKYRNGS